MKLQRPQLRSIIGQIGEKLKTLRTAAQRWGAKPLPVVIVHSGERYEHIAQRVNVVLSPAYYWYKNTAIPLKSPAAARRIAPSIFFSWIPAGGRYRYLSFKENQGYGFIACDPDEVAERLARQGLDSRWIERFYFAQCALDSGQSPLAVGEQGALMHVSGAWVAVPRRYAPQAQSADESPRMLDGPFLRVAKVRESGMSRRHFAVAASLLLLLMGAQGVNLWRDRTEAARLEAARAALLEKARLPQTTLQLESIERRLTTIAAAQTRLREQLSDLLALPVAPARLERLQVLSQKIEAEYAAGNDEAEAALAGTIKARFPGASIASSNGRLTVAISW